MSELNRLMRIAQAPPRRLRRRAELEAQLRFYRQRQAAERATGISFAAREMANYRAHFYDGAVQALEWALGIAPAEGTES